MRVGYLTYGLDRSPTGIGRYALQLLYALAALPGGPEIVLLTTERQDAHGLWRRFEHHPLPGCHLLPALMTYGNLAVAGAVRRHRLDIIHDPNGIAPFLGPRSGAGRIVTIHDAFPYVYPEAHNRLDNWRYWWQLPRAAKRADAVLTVSACSQQDLMRALGIAADRISITPEGVDARFRPLPDDAGRRSVLAHYGITRPYLIYVGGINARKNISRLFEAFARLLEGWNSRTGVDGVPRPMLVIGGKRQWQTSEIDATFRRLNLEDDVRFTGYIDDADLPALYSAAEMLVFPSLYEGFGLPPLEAMACGTMVVTSNVSSLPEVVGDAALTVDPYDVAALAEAMLRGLTDPALRASLSQRGRQRATMYAWERAADATCELYERVLTRANGRSAIRQIGG